MALMSNERNTEGSFQCGFIETRENLPSISCSIVEIGSTINGWFGRTLLASRGASCEQPMYFLEPLSSV